MKNDIDALLQQALAPKEEPGSRLKCEIMIRAKEREQMEKRKFKLSLGTVAAVMMFLFSAFGVYAGAKYLSADKVAETFCDRLLSTAFRTEDAILVNEGQEYAGYRITLLGVVSGKGLSEYTQWDEQGQIVEDKTYIVTAIENADGTFRPDVSDDAYGEDPFYASPYIRGLSMADYNAHTLGGGYSENVIEGIQYRIMECDNIEMFAGRGLYLGVTDGDFYQAQAFVMDGESGVISRNENYGGVNALFELPIPKELGDEAAVEEYLHEKAERREQCESEELDTDDVLEALYKKVKTWTLEDFEANSKRVFEQELIIDDQGFISYAHDFGGAVNHEATVLADMLFEERMPGLSEYVSIFEGSPVYLETYELLENGNIKLRIYEYHM